MTELKERRYLIRRPRALQYFQNGQLRRELEKERVAGRFELFLDLLCMDKQICSLPSMHERQRADSEGMQMSPLYVTDGNH